MGEMSEFCESRFGRNGKEAHKHRDFEPSRYGWRAGHARRSGRIGAKFCASSRAHWNDPGSTRRIQFVPIINRTTAAAIASRMGAASASGRLRHLPTFLGGMPAAAWGTIRSGSLFTLPDER